MPPDSSPKLVKVNTSKLDWEGLAEVINQLPGEEREKYFEMMNVFIHNLRQSIGVVYAAEALLRKMIVDDKLENPMELLNAMQIAYHRMFDNIKMLSDTFDAYDH